MTDAARPIDKPTRGRDVLGEYLAGVSPAMLGSPAQAHRITATEFMKSYQPGVILPVPIQPTSDIHELLDRLEAKVAGLVRRKV